MMVGPVEGAIYWEITKLFGIFFIVSEEASAKKYIVLSKHFR